MSDKYSCENPICPLHGVSSPVAEFVTQNLYTGETRRVLLNKIVLRSTPPVEVWLCEECGSENNPDSYKRIVAIADLKANHLNYGAEQGKLFGLFTQEEVKRMRALFGKCRDGGKQLHGVGATIADLQLMSTLKAWEHKMGYSLIGSVKIW